MPSSSGGGGGGAVALFPSHPAGGRSCAPARPRLIDLLVAIPSRRPPRNREKVRLSHRTPTRRLCPELVIPVAIHAKDKLDLELKYSSWRFPDFMDI
jgi:hypothetical protein